MSKNLTPGMSYNDLKKAEKEKSAEHDKECPGCKEMSSIPENHLPGCCTHEDHSKDGEVPPLGSFCTNCGQRI